MIIHLFSFNFNTLFNFFILLSYFYGDIYISKTTMFLTISKKINIIDERKKNYGKFYLFR